MNKRMIVRMAIVLMALIPLPSSAGRPAAPGAPTAVIEKGDFRFSCDERGISALANPHDPFGATLMPAGPAGWLRRPSSDSSSAIARQGPEAIGPSSPRADRSGRLRPGAERSAIRAAARRRPSRSSRPSRRTAASSTGRSTSNRPARHPSRSATWAISIPSAGPYGRGPRPDLRARISPASVRLRPRLVLLFRPRFGRAALPAGHGPARGRSSSTRPGRPRRDTGLRPFGPDGRRRDARHVAPGPHRARARPGRPAREPGLVRLPDAVGRRATTSSATSSTQRGCSTSASCRA